MGIKKKDLLIILWFCLLSSLYPGAILIAQPLDYETCRDYFLTVEACDGGTPPLSAITTVNINLTDVNDNAPMFSRELYTAVVSEDATIGESVVQVSPTSLWVSFCSWKVKVWEEHKFDLCVHGLNTLFLVNFSELWLSLP